MKIIKHNGEYWYEEDRPLFGHVARWLAWFGGWEAHAKGGWTLRQRLGMLAPVSLFGHRVTWYGWGAQVRLGRDWLVVVWGGGDGRCAYVSRNGTPQGAHVWFYGAPRDVVMAAQRRGRPADDRMVS